ncbi:alpha-ribazole-5'-phosphate phosphatase [Clostridia bacterium]|nr:alpha-ribazole-5'-phosphate phosphatase [Clostridia bacterium]
MKIALIRHGKTQGNIERQYIGSTDLPLAPSGRDELAELAASGRYPKVDRVYASPMLRCLQTAGIIYPGIDPVPVPGLRECDFGIFEGKTHEVLIENEDYKSFLESGGNYAFPGGDSFEGFVGRCAQAFDGIIDDIIADGINSSAVVCHGGSIMAIMSTFGEPPGKYYDWQVQNGMGYIVRLVDNRKVTLVTKIDG